MMTPQDVSPRLHIDRTRLVNMPVLAYLYSRQHDYKTDIATIKNPEKLGVAVHLKRRAGQDSAELVSTGSELEDEPEALNVCSAVDATTSTGASRPRKRMQTDSKVKLATAKSSQECMNDAVSSSRSHSSACSTGSRTTVSNNTLATSTAGSAEGLIGKLATLPKKIGDGTVIESTGMVRGMHQPVVQMVDSTDLFHRNDCNALWQRFLEHGYVYIKKAINQQSVLNARQSILETLESLDITDLDGIPRQGSLSKGTTVDMGSGCAIDGKNENVPEKDPVIEEKWQLWHQCATQKPFRDIIDSNSILKAVDHLSRGKMLTERCPSKIYKFYPNYSWLRIKLPNECTPIHADIFYYKKYTAMFNKPCSSDQSGLSKLAGNDEEAADNYRDSTSTAKQKYLACEECDIESLEVVTDADGSSYCKDCKIRPTLITCWVPLGEAIDVNDGVLAVLPNSATLPNFFKVYSGADQLPKSYFAHAKKLTWHTSPFEAGDFVLFDSRIVHCSTNNYADHCRTSLDFRWCLGPQRKTWGETPLSKFIEGHDSLKQVPNSLSSSTISSTLMN